MIPLNFGLFWCGGNISYLRYLTFKSLRFFHPNSKILLYVSKNYNKNIHKWGGEKQDFEQEIDKDYKKEISKLDVKIIEMDFFGNPNFCAIFQVDLFRWWALYNGICNFYLDMDQIILRSFDTLPLDYDFIYSQFSNYDRPKYAPTGVLGCSKNNEFAKKMMGLVPKFYRPNVYNSSGPFVLEHALATENTGNSFNAPYNYFYPINCSRDVGKIYSGEFIIPKESYSLHWYAGHPISQEFNKNYNEDFLKKSKDSISVFCKDKIGIL